MAPLSSLKGNMLSTLMLYFFVHSFSQAELIKETIENWNLYITNTNMFRFIQYSTYTFIKISLIAKKIWISRSRETIYIYIYIEFYFEQQDLTISPGGYRKPINNRIFDKFISELMVYNMLFILFLHWWKASN